MAPPLGSGRREADQLLLLLLRENGCAIPKGVSSVAQMTSDMVINVVGSLVPGIDGCPPLADSVFERGLHPAERHHVCKIIATRVKQAGYAEPLSAYQLLYPGEGGTRRLLLALLSMLPASGATATSSRTASSTKPVPSPGTPGEQARPSTSDLLSGSNAARTDPHVHPDPAQAGLKDDSSSPAGSSDSEEPHDGAESEAGEQPPVETTPEESGAAEPAALANDDSGAEGEQRGTNHLSAEADTLDGEASNDEQELEAGGGAVRSTDQISVLIVDEETGSAAGVRHEPNEFESDATLAEMPAGSATFLDVKGSDSIAHDGAVLGEVVDEDRQHDDDDEEDEDEEDNVFQQGPAASTASMRGRWHGGDVAESPTGASDTVFGRDDELTDDENVFGGGYQEQQSADAQRDGGELGDDHAQSAGSREDQPAELVSAAEPSDLDDPVSTSHEKDALDSMAATVHPDASHAEESAVDASDAGADENTTPNAEPMAVFSEERHDADVSLPPARTDRETTNTGLGNVLEPVSVRVVDADRDSGGRDLNQASSGSAVIDVQGDGVDDSAQTDEMVGTPAAEMDRDQRQANEEEEGVTSQPLDDAGGACGGAEEVAPKGEDEDVVFLQFAVEAQEVELQRLEKERDALYKESEELETEVRSLGVLTEKRERNCRVSAKALELLPRVTEERAELQQQCTAAETRMAAARKTFDRIKKPLEEVVRAQREELTRRKVQCRALLSDMREIYDECESMGREESSLRSMAAKLEAWETQGHGDEYFLVGGTDARPTPEWEYKEEDEGYAKKRRSGELLRADLDSRIASLCEEAMTHKQEVAISLSEVLDSRRETNVAWEGLGRTEALAEEKLFAAAKEASTSGGSKDRAKDLVEAYRRLNTLQDSFSKLVEAVSEAGKRGEECQVVEDETEFMLSEGEAAHLEHLMRDLKRVRGDAAALERRLDNALEEERQMRQAFEADKRMQEEHEERVRQQSLEQEEQGHEEHQVQHVETEAHDHDSQGVILTDKTKLSFAEYGGHSDRVREDTTVLDTGVEQEHDANMELEGKVVADDDSVDFVADDDGDNFWEQVDIPPSQAHEVEDDVVVVPEKS